MSQTTFDRRVTQLESKHRRLADGVTYRIGADGLITAHPYRRFSPSFPAKGFLLLLVTAVAFKAALLVASGPATYEARLAELAHGRTVEKGLAWLMQPDVVTRSIASGVAFVTQATAAELP